MRNCQGNSIRSEEILDKLKTKLNELDHRIFSQYNVKKILTLCNIIRKPVLTYGVQLRVYAKPHLKIIKFKQNRKTSFENTNKNT